MHRTRLLALLPLALAAVGAHAQTEGAAQTGGMAGALFDGPAPLAWRWQGFAKTLSGGSPIVQGDRVLIALGNRMYALDRTSGNQIWRFPLADPIEGNFRTSPILVDGVLVAVSDNKNIYGVDPDTGALKWTYQAPAQVLGNPVVTSAGKSVAFQMQGSQIQSIVAATGEPQYSAPLLVKDRIAGQIAGYGDSIIYFTQNGRLTSIASGSQRPIWSKSFTVLPPVPQPIIVGETLYSFSGQYLVALNAAAGSTRFQARLVESPFSSPIIGTNGSLVVSDSGKAYYYDRDGNLKTPKPIDVGSQPVVTGTAVGTKFLVPTVNGALNLVDPATSKVEWSFVVRPSTSPDSGAVAARQGPSGGEGSGGPGGGSGGGVRRTDSAPTTLYSIQASAPVAFAGSTLLVPARDGSLLAFDREIGVDLTPPDTRLVWPTPGEDVNGQAPLEMIFKIQDEASGLKLDTLKLEIDGNPYTTEFTKDGFLVAKISTSGANKPLSNGRHTLVVTAQDWMGNEAKKTIALNVDNSLKPLVRPTPGANPNGAPGGPGGPGGGGGRPGGFGGPGGGG